jgi:transcriptional regulator with XRE-family HTH domain
MAYTSFGEFVRILRIKHHEIMGDMAKMLGVKVPFLSAVENGKKNVPVEWINKIVDYYNLDSGEQERLKEVIEESKTQYKIKAQNAGKLQRKAAVQFARSFDNIDDETAERIIELLNNKENTNDGLQDESSR